MYRLLKVVNIGNDGLFFWMRHWSEGMKDFQLEHDIEQAKNGNELVRHQLINRYKPYILNIVRHICKRVVSWSDEESSIGLIAFNRAIDTYDSEKGRTFISYAYFLMNRDLINYYHQKNKDNKILSLDYKSEGQESLITDIEIEQAMREYQVKVESTELVDEILELDQQLNEYSIGFEELESSSPKHRDTRESIHRIVHDFMEDKECMNELFRKKRFPTTLFVRKTGYHHKTFERYRKYIITLILIKLHPEWEHLRRFVE